MTYQAIANSSLYHCGNRWIVADEHYKTISEHCTYEAAKQEADRLNSEMEETTMTNTLTDNQKHCKYIADNLEQIAEGVLYRCPECGELVSLDDMHGYDESREDAACVKFNCCGVTVCKDEMEEPEQVSMLDYFADCYNIEWRLDSNREYKSVQVMVTCGGPNIYVDTGAAAVELYWWGDSARWNISREAVAAIDEAFEELFNC